MARKRSHTRRTPHSNPRGVLDVRRGGFGFAQTAEGEFFIPAAKMNGAFDGDFVEVAPLPSARGKAAGGRNRLDETNGHKHAARVVRVLSRAHDTLVGRYEVAEPFGVVVPEDPRIGYDIFTERRARPDIPDGAIVRVRITAYPTRNSAATGVVEEVMGASDDEHVPIDLIVARYKLETVFSEASLAQVADARVDADDALAQGYADIRNRFTFTVDPADARDFDDAVSLEPVGALAEHTLDGEGPEADAVQARAADKGARWRLGVHIADVSHYVPWNSSVDLDARRRATSVYLVDRVVPMLPEKLSNDVCSLRPNEDRRCMTVDMYLDDAGTVVESRVYPALMRSHARLTYDEAQRLLDGAADASDASADGNAASADRVSASGEASGCGMAGARVDGNVADAAGGTGLAADLARRLRGLSRIAQLRFDARIFRGGMDFQTTEAKVRLDAEGVPTGVDVRKKTPATSLIEEAMILANETVARTLRDVGFPCVYRVHEQPARENLAALVPVLAEFPWFKKVNARAFEAGNPLVVAQVLALSADRPEALLVSTLVLRSMKRAVYQPECDVHYGLASDCYCHFTSPIRRYPDLIVHRMLKALLFGRPQKFDQEVSKLAWLSEHSSKMERVAEKAARDSQDVKLVEFMEDKIGQTFSAYIAGVANYGLFVRLENTAEGMVSVEDLGREYFALDPVRHTLTGTDSGRMFRLGQHVAVVLVAADHHTRRLDFRLVGVDAGRTDGRARMGGRAETGRRGSLG